MNIFQKYSSYIYTLIFPLIFFLSLGVLIQVLCLPRSYEAHSFLRASSVVLFNIYSKNRVWERKIETEREKKRKREKE